MTENTHVEGHVLNNVVPADGIEISSQNLSLNPDGSANLMATRSQEAGPALPLPNPSLSMQQNVALHYAFKRTLQAMAGAPAVGGPRAKGGRPGWTHSGSPLKLSGPTMNLFQQINTRNPLSDPKPLLRFFRSMELEGVQMNFVRKADLSVIHALQYSQGITRNIPHMSLGAGRRKKSRAPFAYATLRNYTSPKEVVQHTIWGNQVKQLSQAAGLPNILQTRPTPSARPDKYKMLRQLVLQDLKPEEPKRKPKPRAGFGLASWAAPSPK